MSAPGIERRDARWQRRREYLRRAAEDGERLYRMLMAGEDFAVKDDFRLFGILTLELESALGFVDELLATRASRPQDERATKNESGGRGGGGVQDG